jgi:choline dehydrogenase
VKRGPVTNPLFHAFIQAGSQAGFEMTQDYNGSKQEGFGLMEQTIHNGRRWSAANAYLRPALKRKNVELIYGWRRRSSSRTAAPSALKSKGAASARRSRPIAR